MSTQKMIVILVGLGLAVVGGLVYLATAGNAWAGALLFAGWSILCLVMGWTLSMVQHGRSRRNERLSFEDNLKENIGIMSAMQTVQNKQNQSLMSQLSTTARLPTVGPGLDNGLIIDQTIFDELESGL